MAVGGVWPAGINMGLFVWALHSGLSVKEAVTMTFVSLVLIQFFKAYNFRPDRNSILRKHFSNHWLNIAVLWELVLLAFIIYMPVPPGSFGTFSPSCGGLDNSDRPLSNHITCAGVDKMDGKGGFREVVPFLNQS